MMHKTCWGNKIAWKVGKKKGKGWKRGEKEEEMFFWYLPDLGKKHDTLGGGNLPFWEKYSPLQPRPHDENDGQDTSSS